ncbi:NUDIX hydrolase [Candidatus Woesearchaeota archaeon]|nr:NUDIX hydrolase [Candidatus Woesearchaeota archaeon]
MKPKRLSRSVIYENPWVNLYVDKVQFPDGRIIDKHHLLDFEKEAVAILIENSSNQILLVNVYRYATNTIEWEIPAGGIDKGESVIKAAEREALEETGYKTDNHKQIYTYYPMNGISNKVYHIVHCKADKKIQNFDKNEIKESKWCNKEEIESMIKEKTINGGFALTSLLLYLQNTN